MSLPKTKGGKRMEKPQDCRFLNLYPQNEVVVFFFLLVFTIALLLGAVHTYPGRKWCCVHTLNTWYATTGVDDYSISPCQTPFWNLSLAVRTRRWTAPELTKNGVLTRTHRPCTRTLALCPNACLGTWSLDVFTLVSSKYRTRAPCPGTRCEPCLRFLMCSCCSFSGLWIYVHCNLKQEKGSSLWGHLALITLSSIWI